MALYTQIEGPVLRILNVLMADEQLAEDLEYHLFAGQAFDDSVGYNVDTYEVSNVRAVRLRHSLKSASVATGEVQSGDMFFLFRFADLPATISKKDRLVDANGIEFHIRGIDKVFGLAISISVDGQ